MKMQKKRVLAITFVFLIFSLILMSFVSAAWYDSLIGMFKKPQLSPAINSSSTGGAGGGGGSSTGSSGGAGGGSGTNVPSSGGSGGGSGGIGRGYSCNSSSDCPPLNCLMAPCPTEKKCVNNLCQYSYSGSNTSTNQTCIDSDNGINYNVKGETKGTHRVRGYVTHIDECITSTLLSEASCEGDKQYVEFDRYVCPNSCKDGACIEALPANSTRCGNGICEQGEEAVLCVDYALPNIPGKCSMICPQDCSEKIAEEVKCLFKNSKTEQKCYTDNGKFSCSGKESCVINISGYKGEEIIWKSSCGEYAYTKMDGESEYAKFECRSGETNETEIINKGFRYAYWQCYNDEEEKSGTETSCKPGDIWHQYAKAFCENKCNADNTKCGVNSFALSTECYPETWDIIEGINETIIGGQEEDFLICKDSCPLDSKCYPFGYRKANKYCSDVGKFIEQLKQELSCENNFECKSNLCIDNQCINQGTFQKFLSWFKNLFG